MSFVNLLTVAGRPVALAAPERRRLLGTLAASLALPSAFWTLPARAARGASSTRQDTPLILAQEAPDDIDPAGWLVSEKYDGVRAWWDGHTLRFRSGQEIAAPRSFLRGLPAVPLDGELWLGRGRFDELSGIVRRHQPDETAWQPVRYMVFEMPGAGGRFDARARQLRQWLPQADAAEEEFGGARDALPASPWFGPTQPMPEPSRDPQTQGRAMRSQAQAVTQWTIPDRRSLRAALDRVVQAGGEGLMLHRADAAEVLGRSGMLLKLKPVHDDEAVVVGYQPGRGRLSDMVGALQVLDDEGRRFEIGSGISDAQRLSPPAVGTRITFTYRGRTPAGLPRFATFLRVREV